MPRSQCQRSAARADQQQACRLRHFGQREVVHRKLRAKARAIEGVTSATGRSELERINTFEIEAIVRGP